MLLRSARQNVQILPECSYDPISPWRRAALGRHEHREHASAVLPELYLRGPPGLRLETRGEWVPR